MTTDANIFKAYDIRGRYPKEINEKVVAEISQRLGEYFPSKVVVAHDSRLSSLGLYKAVLNQLKTKKLKTIEVGLVTVPMFYFLVRQQKASGGIMITASHNPKGYNGMKVVDKNALSISGWEIKKMLKP